MAFSMVRGGLYGASTTAAPSPRLQRHSVAPAAAAARASFLDSRQRQRSGWLAKQGAERASVLASAGRGGAPSTLDAPTTTLPGNELSKERKLKRPPIYKVMLHNDNYNRREYVVKVLLKVIQSITVDDAVIAMQEAHETGVSMVIACPQEDAERYCEGLRLNGLTSTIEPTR